MKPRQMKSAAACFVALLLLVSVPIGVTFSGRYDWNQPKPVAAVQGIEAALEQGQPESTPPIVEACAPSHAVSAEPSWRLVA